jgi:hypothetical protein
VGAVLAAKTLGTPTPAQASHKGPVYLGDFNSAGFDGTAIECDAARATFIGRNTWPNVYGSPAHGVLGECQAASDESSGVRGVAANRSGLACGVHGIAHGIGAFPELNQWPIGVRGEAPGDGARGVYGEALNDNGTGTGVVGVGGFAGVWGQATSEASVGVLADSADEGEALRANGDVRVVAEDGQTAFRVEAEGPYFAGETAIFVRRNVGGGTFSLERVSVGAANSGGTGFRVLRVPN